MSVINRAASDLSLRRRRRSARDDRPAERGEIVRGGECQGEPGMRITDTRRRAAIAPQDQAVYSCPCGFVFAAAVSASVDCPHCGVAQAW